MDDCDSYSYNINKHVRLNIIWQENISPSLHKLVETPDAHFLSYNFKFLPSHFLFNSMVL